MPLSATSRCTPWVTSTSSVLEFVFTRSCLIIALLDKVCSLVLLPFACQNLPPLHHGVLPPSAPGVLEDGINDMGHEGIDAGKVSDEVQVDVARLDGFTEPFPEPLEV